MTKILFMKFSCIQYVKKKDSTVLCMESTFTMSTQQQVFRKTADLDREIYENRDPQEAIYTQFI